MILTNISGKKFISIVISQQQSKPNKNCAKLDMEETK